MSDRKLPVRPDLDQLRHQAKDLLRNIRRGDPAAIAEFNIHHPKAIDPGSARLMDAQLALARSYQAPSWQRLVQACKLIDAIWRDDIEAVRELVVKNPHLLHEAARIRESNWGPPLSYAANLGRDRIIQKLHELDLEHAIGRARQNRHGAHASNCIPDTVGTRCMSIVTSLPCRGDGAFIARSLSASPQCS